MPTTDIAADRELLLVVAAVDDVAARAWAARDRTVRLLTPADLGTPNWTLEDGRVSSLLAAGRSIDPQSVSGVVTRLPRVTSDDLGWLRPTDRCFAAAEFTAFLTAALTALPAPIVNQPTGGDLCGEVNPLVAARAALAAGWQVATLPGRSSSHVLDIHVVDGTAAAVTTVLTPGPTPAPSVTLRDRAESVARAVGLPLVRIRLHGIDNGRTGPAALACTADPWVDVSHPRVADRVRSALRTRARR